jgi:hypothetical protein
LSFDLLDVGQGFCPKCLALSCDLRFQRIHALNVVIVCSRVGVDIGLELLVALFALFDRFGKHVDLLEVFRADLAYDHCVKLCFLCKDPDLQLGALRAQLLHVLF